MKTSVFYRRVVPFILASMLMAAFIQPMVANAEKGAAASTLKGQVLFTQFTLFHESYVHRTTNYRKGIIVPVNTQVTFVAANSDSIEVKLPDGHNLRILNIENFSGENIDGIFARTFATTPVDLSNFTKDEKQAIMLGEPLVGMTKATVLIAMGYPPKHKTPNLELDQWRYWRNRFSNFLVYFENGRVTNF